MDEQRDVDTNSSPAGDDDLSGRRLADKYEVIRPLGTGATGTVYLCFHATLDKHVAIKVLHAELAEDAAMVTRFQREAQAAARLDHPNSIHVSDFGHDPATKRLYIAMDYVEGRDLAQIIDEDWPLADLRVAGIMSQVLSALGAAHRLGIVHRDLKPENILVSGLAGAMPGTDVVKVCDFSIAQLSPIRLRGQAGSAVRNARLSSITAQGTVVGTPAYMSPEQARGEAQDARSDIYSAGVVLFQLLTRTVPFAAETPLSIAVMHCLTPPPPPSGYSAVNPALEAICLKALSKTREARYQSAREMQSAIEAAVARKSGAQQLRRISVPPPAGSAAISAVSAEERDGSLTPAERAIDPARPLARRPRVPLIATGCAAAGLIALLGWPYFSAEDESSAEAETAPAFLAPQPSAAAELPAPVPELALPASQQSVILPSAALAEPPPSAASPQPREVGVLASAARVKRRRAVSAAEPEHAPVHTSTSTAASLDAAYASDGPTLVLPAAAISGRSTAPAAKTEGAAAAEPETGAAPQADHPMTALASPLAESAPAKPAPQPVASRLAAPAAQPATASPAAPLAPAPAGLNVASARVAIGSTSGHSVSKASVRAALNQGALDHCYRDALRNGHVAPARYSGRLDIATNMGGRIVSASMDAAALPKSLRQCIEQTARTGRVREVDTGEAQASIELSFEP
jgi:eukaryotic-like serine/threonine-protein kinase